MNSEPRLYEAFDRYVQQQDQQLPTEQELESVTLSEGLNKRMEKLLRRESRGYYVLFGTAARRVASVAAALLVTASVATVSVEALRRSVGGFLMKVFDTHSILWAEPDPDAPAVDILPKREPTYIPDGYVMIRHEDYDGLYKWRYWSVDTDHTIIYSQTVSDATFSIDTEGVTCTEVAVGDTTALTYTKKGITTLIWRDEHGSHLFTTEGELEELIPMAESLEERGEGAS